MHGGTVRATSPGEGQGSTFIVRLPLRAVQANVVEAPENHSSPGAEPVAFDVSRLRGLKVLVVDDEPDARELIKRFLVVYQAVPILADSADEALRLIGMFRPDVIVSDIGMPLRDGYALMREVRSQNLSTPAIALTAFARSEDRGRALRAGYQTHLSKPFEPLELLAVVAGLSNR
jgi:CheY-like chemotaxis protein